MNWIRQRNAAETVWATNLLAFRKHQKFASRLQRVCTSASFTKVAMKWRRLQHQKVFQLLCRSLGTQHPPGLG